jgi:hypothetical protein
MDYFFSCWSKTADTLHTDDFIVVTHDPDIIQYCPLCMKEMERQHIECIWCQQNIGDRLCISTWLKTYKTCPRCKHCITVY